jgi:hypothetical protein
MVLSHILHILQHLKLKNHTACQRVHMNLIMGLRVTLSKWTTRERCQNSVVNSQIEEITFF